jgi:hypothetical protein
MIEGVRARLTNLATGEEVPITAIALHTTEEPQVGTLYIPQTVSFSTSLEVQHVDIEVMALLWGLRLVDASIWWEDHIVRGEN